MAKQNIESRIQNPESGAAQASDLAAENATLRARVAELESAKTRNDTDETLITAKMAKGLRREQARAVIYRQREFDNKKQSKTTNQN